MEVQIKDAQNPDEPTIINGGKFTQIVII